MAGVSGEEVDLADAITIAEWMVRVGRIPPPTEWIESLTERVNQERLQANLSALF